MTLKTITITTLNGPATQEVFTFDANGKTYQMFAPTDYVNAKGETVTGFAYYQMRNGRTWGPVRQASSASKNSEIYRVGMSGWDTAHDMTDPFPACCPNTRDADGSLMCTCGDATTPEPATTLHAQAEAWAVKYLATLAG